MTQDEYILGLLAIISGLAISHMIGALHGLLFNCRMVRWDWLTPLTAANVACLILYSWWVSWASFHGRSEPLIFGWFLIPVAQLTCLFLAARAILPDFDGETHLDLKEHYEKVSRYVWAALASNLLLVLFNVIMVYLLRGLGPSNAISLAALIPGLVAELVLVVTRRRIVHAVLVPILGATLLASTLTKVL